MENEKLLREQGPRERRELGDDYVLTHLFPRCVFIQARSYLDSLPSKAKQPWNKL